MNTKKVFFGLLAVAFLAMTVVATEGPVDIEDQQTTSVKKKNIVRR